MAKEFLPLDKPKTVADMRNTSRNLKAEAANKKTPMPVTNERPPTEKIRPGFKPATEKIRPGFRPEGEVKPMPKGGKAPMAAETKPVTSKKPLTNTSGTATATAKKGSAWFDKMKKSIEFGAKYAGNAGVMAAALGVSVTKKSRDNPTAAPLIINPREQSVMPAGTILPAKVREMGKPTTTEKPPTDTGSGGIDAPAPDTGWRPSGTNTASGLQQKTMGVALQEQIGVTKRRR